MNAPRESGRRRGAHRPLLALAAAFALGCASTAPDADEARPTAPDAPPAARPTPADPADLDMEAILRETQIVHADANRLRVVWWIPVEHWEVMFAMPSSRVEPEQAQLVLDTLRPYTLFGVSVADVAPDGALAFAPEEQVRAGLRLETPTGPREPLPEESIPPDVASLLAGMQPAIARYGEFGQKMSLFVFDNRTGTGSPLVSPRAPGMLVLSVEEHAFRWWLPLGSFLSPKVCPIDQEPMSGAWTFCPRHGVRLD